MANTRTSVCNHALTLVKQSPIASINDDNPRARACLRVFDVSANALLGKDNWSFASYRAALSASPDAPEFGFNYQFPLPTSPRFLRLIDTSLYSDDAWSVEAGVLLSDMSEVSIRYVGETPVGSWSDGFAMAVAARVATQIAPELAQDPNLAMLADRAETKYFAEAKQIDLLHRPARDKVRRVSNFRSGFPQ